MPVYSPITKNVSFKIDSIEVDTIINKYRKNLKIDVSSYFIDIDEIGIFECPDSKYRFYHPFNTFGNNEFYKQLQEIEWYYMPWKWEHEETLKLLHPGLKVLEVGCAKGDFLKKAVVEKQIDAIGLELNDEAIKIGKKHGLNIMNKSIEEFAFENENKFDIVCSFQVLEHITDIKSFINAQIKCLKPNGSLIVSVPNNHSFYQHYDSILNFPPHHMGLWTQESLVNLEAYFPIKLKEIILEPLQNYHKKIFHKSIAKLLKKTAFLHPKIGRLIIHLIPKFLFSKNYKSFTLLAIYTKLT